MICDILEVMVIIVHEKDGEYIVNSNEHIIGCRDNNQLVVPQVYIEKIGQHYNALLRNEENEIQLKEKLETTHEQLFNQSFENEVQYLNELIECEIVNGRTSDEDKELIDDNRTKTDDVKTKKKNGQDDKVKTERNKSIYRPKRERKITEAMKEYKSYQVMIRKK